MTDSNGTVRLNASRLRWQQTTTALLCGTTLVTLPMLVNAQESGEGSDNGEGYRLAPIIVNAQAYADDDANSIVAQEL
tara:strand:- start:299 stop:532 length:234 start_codon:yes stop_codon:yes gene_type:complete